ncbi:MAG: outer membrane protein [Sphingomonadaceae bacterium]
MTKLVPSTPLLAGLAALAGLAGAASAEPFNGGYVGAELGWQQDRARTTVTVGAPPLRQTDKGSSFAYGGVLGYDAKVANGFVLGAEASLSGDSGKIDGPRGLEYDAGRTFGLAARAGVLATPETLVYGRGGWVNSRFTVDDGTNSRGRNRDGWTLGGGIEQMLASNVSAKVEYRYSRFKSLPARTADISVDDATARFGRNQIMAGINYRF